MTKLLLFGEPLIRITPVDVASLGDQVVSTTYFGGSEVNIACNLQALGICTKLFTGLPDNEIGNRFLTFLKQHDIDTSTIFRLGDRLGVYYLENGFMHQEVLLSKLRFRYLGSSQRSILGNVLLQWFLSRNLGRCFLERLAGRYG